MAGTSSSTTVSTKLGQIAKLAREMPQAALTTLAHHIDIDWLREAYSVAQGWSHGHRPTDSRRVREEPG